MFERFRRNALAILAVAIAGAAAFAVSASAAVPANACGSTLVQPFLKWKDTGYYGLVPGGSFEGVSSWSVTGGASVAAGNETFFVNGAGDSNSLNLPAGSSATSPEFCVEVGKPFTRLFFKGGNSTSSLRIELLLPTTTGKKVVLVGSLTGASTTWKPTSKFPLLASTNGLIASNGTAKVQLRITAISGSASWSVDDVYVDPRKGN